MTVGDRIRILRGNDSRKTLGLKLGVDQATIARYENNQRVPDIDFVSSLCRLYGVTADWLICGEMQETFGLSKVTDGEHCLVPIKGGELSAGGGRAVEIYEGQRFIKMDIEDARAIGDPKNLRAMIAKGDSMEPLIMDKDVVIFDKSRQDVRDGKVYVVAWDGDIHVKKLFKVPSQLYLRSVNSEYKDVPIDLKDKHEADSVKILGQAVWWCHSEHVD